MTGILTIINSPGTENLSSENIYHKLAEGQVMTMRKEQIITH